ncbi:MAG TPA: CpsD/CapB family tyrosine-protein kinase [Ktedonobacteraceae bacterium]|nr:CpsD/CapB family tyrosine-protein kinase [Ktedonobacteraceae bacterium]
MGTSPSEQVTLLTDYDAASAYSTAYQTLYANIRFNWDSERSQSHTLLFTTPATYPGRSIVAANVAIAAAQSGISTILVDADLRAPGLQQRFALSDTTGLSNLLASEHITLSEITAHLNQTFISNLSLIGAGTAQLEQHEASRLLAMKLPDVLTGLFQLIAETEDRSGLIIFNSPPVLTGIDAAQISTFVEQTFLVIASGQTTRAQARQAQEQLQRAHAKLVGIIMLNA